MNDEERESRIETLTDAVAATNRNMGAAIAETNRAVAALTADVASLSRLMRAHLIHDHGYPEIDDDDK